MRIDKPAKKKEEFQTKFRYVFPAILTSLLFPSYVYAGKEQGTGSGNPILENSTLLSDNSNANDYLENMIGILCDIFRYVGIALFVWGSIQFILAIKRTDAESKSDALQTAVVGIALISIKFIINALGIRLNTVNVLTI